MSLALRTSAAAVLAASLVAVSASAATIVYDNTVPDNTLGTYLANSEIGDTITLAGTDRTVTEFVFGYDGDFDAGAMAVVRFYWSEPLGSEPGDLQWESPAFPIDPKSSLFDYVLIVPWITVPDTFTWTVEFSNISGDSVRLLRYRTPAVGSSGDYWWGRVPGGDWIYSSHRNSSNNLRARVSAVPEPSTALLVAIGLGGLAMRRRRLH